MALVVPAQLAAQSEPVALAWHAPPGCSSADDVLARVRKLTQSAQLRDRQLTADASVSQLEHHRLRLKLTLRSGDLIGERRIDGRNCEDLAGATAVVLALLLRSEAPLNSGDLQGSEVSVEGAVGADGAIGADAAESKPTQVEQAEPSAPVPANPPVDPPPPAKQPEQAPSERRWHGTLQVPLVALGIGPLPRPSAGFGLALGARIEHWSLVADGFYWLEQPLKARDLPDAGAKLQRIEAGLRSCRSFPFGRLELAPCVRLSLQHVWARGTGLHVASQSARASWFAAAVGAQLRYRITQWFSVLGNLDAQLETARPKLSIDDVGSLGQLWPGAFTMMLGSEWIF